MCVQATASVLGGLFLLTWDVDGRRRFATRFLHDQLAVHPIRWGVVLVAFGVALIIGAVGLARCVSWAAPAVYVIEAIAVLGSLLRFHPLRSMIGVGLAVVVVVLVATDAVATGTRSHEQGATR